MHANHCKEPFVERIQDKLIVRGLSSPIAVSQFLRCMKEGVECGYTSFCIDFRVKSAVYPNAATPIAGLLEHYTKEEGIDYEYNCSDIVAKCNIINPLDISENPPEKDRPIGKVWKFNSNNLHVLHQVLMDELRRTVVIANGAFEALEWSLYEIMDNVFVHSEAETGFIMCQVLSASHHVVFDVFDDGIGIYNSLKDSIHHPRSTIDALYRCLQEGVTRDPEIGQGNGMTGLYKLVQYGNGELTVTSGNSYIRFVGGENKDNHSIPCLSQDKQCTSVDFQLDYSKEVSLADFMTFNGKTFTFVNYHVEDLENDRGEIFYKIAEQAEGTGTRDSAKRIKNDILNLYTQSKKIIVLDFDETSITSSSFADELIAKLILEIGLFQFNAIFRLKNMNSQMQTVLQRSVIQRIVTEFNSNETI